MNASDTSTARKPGALQIIILLAALVLMFIGFKNGEHRSYFQKAILVCTQCIGLG
ncbi:MAG TPA: CD1871A family CXXC motif-containing protein [Candidatus Rifleibacterium sp.]|nr:CD1871A family CXXC motif-containing protein [Candidatus Rifleibacterium sp.]HOI91107.1 CD1871A family CXXC motif-containing protein [Candidatus Rifleibacterium sp.]